MKATVEQVGPLRARLYVKEMAPRFALVPVGVLPSGTEKGDVLEMAFEKATEQPADAPAEEVPVPIAPSSKVVAGQQMIRTTY